MDNKSVVLGLSGGVDSAVAACLLKEQGFQVYGHWLDIGLGGRADAEAVAEQLGIPFSAGDIRQGLEEQVMEPFRQDYLAGRTPLPCARCNPTVKFPALFRRAQAVGAQYVATGHYARTFQEEGGPLASTGARRKMTRRICWLACPWNGCPGCCSPWGAFGKPGSGLWPVSLAFRWRRSPTAWRFASSLTRTTPPGWNSGGRSRRRETLWTGTERYWASTGASITTPSASAGG